ncbi:hypothetical protein DE146DRAFT_519716 [Phaeosphaeria sp. MPI-PUGE-AT-0046c]|nr:hypothetical protein DE146DRAFT_519716 [Phaeosphaeria sp. MPI-PUGE-AT-0046c]
MSITLVTRFGAAFWLLLIATTALALSDPTYVVGIVDGKQYRVRDDRWPALYTADYGDCSGESLINVTRFDAAYYRDNMTVMFHLEGETALTSENIMMSIGVFAYGESRFELTFNPCSANINSACPIRIGVPIRAEGIIPVNKDDVSRIPEIALAIPDFEGQAILRIFSNSTQAEVGCFAAQITNGNTFRQKVGVGTVLGVFTLVAISSSFVTATHGDDVVEMRKHYAHSVSVMVVFAVWHHIYFSGALSMNWPSVLVSYWSNYAWTGGMIYSEHMQNSINNFIGSNKGNTSQVGAAGAGVKNPELGGGYDIHAIYRRTVNDAIGGFSYTGQPVKPGTPLPGNFSGFAGMLAQERIPASNAFMTCLFWSLVLVAFILVSIMAFKFVLEALSSTRVMKNSRLTYFRSHYIRYTASSILRAFFIGFFMLTYVSMFQLTYLKSPGTIAVACTIFLVVAFGIGTAAGLACYCRIRDEKYGCERDALVIEMIIAWNILPWLKLSWRNESTRSEHKNYVVAIPWWTIRSCIGEKSIHNDESFILSYGWLASRYRRTRWWFFATWLVYEFIRACFLAGASSQPLVQVFGLLTVESVAFIGMIYLRPFEGQRLNIVLVYFLGFSKVATTALSASFDASFNLPRILATVVGIVIIVIQGLLTITMMVTIIMGAVTSYFSVMRDRETTGARSWVPLRKKYLQGIVLPSSYHVEPMQQARSRSYFCVNQVKRVPKVEDEDEEFLREIRDDACAPRTSIISRTWPGAYEQPTLAGNRLQVSYTALPRAARLHRPSWPSQDFVGQRSGGRARALSNATSSTSHFDESEDLERLPTSSFRTATPVSSPNPRLQIEGDMSSVRQLGSKPSVSSRASSRAALECRIAEEEIPPVPSIRS